MLSWQLKRKKKPSGKREGGNALTPLSRGKGLEKQCRRINEEGQKTGREKNARFSLGNESSGGGRIRKPLTPKTIVRRES